MTPAQLVETVAGGWREGGGWQLVRDFTSGIDESFLTGFPAEQTDIASIELNMSAGGPER